MRIVIFLFFTAILAACNNSTNSSNNEPVEKTGEEIYETTCSMCHGQDGKKQLSGAKDLSISPLDIEAQKDIITNGKGGMAAYKNMLSESEIDKVVIYIQTLRTEE